MQVITSLISISWASDVSIDNSHRRKRASVKQNTAWISASNSPEFLYMYGYLLFRWAVSTYTSMLFLSTFWIIELHADIARAILKKKEARKWSLTLSNLGCSWLLARQNWSLFASSFHSAAAAQDWDEFRPGLRALAPQLKHSFLWFLRAGLKIFFLIVTCHTSSSKASTPATARVSFSSAVISLFMTVHRSFESYSMIFQYD